MSNINSSAARINDPYTPDQSAEAPSSDRHAAEQKIKDAASTAKAKAHAEGGARMTQAGGEAKSTADDLREAATHVDNQFISTALTGASAQLRKAADYLTENEPADSMAHLNEIGRKSPGLFLAGAFALGVALGQAGRIAVPQEHDPAEGDDA